MLMWVPGRVEVSETANDQARNDSAQAAAAGSTVRMEEIRFEILTRK